MKSILFLGNSFTFFNDLPKMFVGLAAEEGAAFFADSVLRGGAYLHQFADPADELHPRLLAKISERAWDIVVLQDQSANPALHPDDHVASVKKLAALFPNQPQFLLYQTWSYRDATEKLRSVNLTYTEMHDKLRDGYKKSAAEIGGTLVPVGDAFAHATASGIDVYCPDDFHPNPNGTYIAACTFYKVLTGKEMTAYPPEVDAETAKICRTAAASV